MPPMKIATYNVNGVNGRLPVLLRWLAESTPDIVCLQEIKAPQDKFPERAIRDAGYGVIWHGQKSYNGGRDPRPRSRAHRNPSGFTRRPRRSAQSLPRGDDR